MDTSASPSRSASASVMGYLVLTGPEHTVHAVKANQEFVVGGVAFTASLLHGPVLQLTQKKTVDDLTTAASEAKLDHSLKLQCQAGELSMTSANISELSNQIEQDPSCGERLQPQLVAALILRGNQKRQLDALRSEYELPANVKRTRQEQRQHLEPHRNYALSDTLSVRWFPDEPPQKPTVSYSDEVDLVSVKIPAQEGCTFGVRGAGDGQLGLAHNEWGIQGIAGSGGLLFVADTENHRVVVARRDGMFVRTIESYGVDREKFQCIKGLCTSNDELFVVDSDAHRIVVLSFEGVWLRTFGGAGVGEGQFNQPHGVSVTDDVVLVADTDNHRVVVLGRDGTFVRAFGKKGNAQGEFERPFSVALQGQRVFVADHSNHRVVITDLQASHFIYVGGVTFTFGVFICPCHVFCDGTQVFVSDRGNDRVVVLDLDGKPLRKFGEPLRQKRHDELNGPCATWVDGTDVFVADSRHCRVFHHSMVN